MKLSKGPLVALALLVCVGAASALEASKEPSKIETTASSRKLMGAEWYARDAQRSGTVSGTSTVSATGPNGGTVSGTHSGTANYNTNVNRAGYIVGQPAYRRTVVVGGRKLASADSANVWFRSTQRSGTVSGSSSLTATGPNGGTVSGSRTGTASGQSSINASGNGRKLASADSADWIRTAQRSGTVSGTSTFYATGPNGGTVSGTRSGTANYNTNVNRAGYLVGQPVYGYRRAVVVGGRKLASIDPANSAESADAYGYRNVERSGSVSGAGAYDVEGPNGGSVSGYHAGTADFDSQRNTYYHTQPGYVVYHPTPVVVYHSG